MGTSYVDRYEKPLQATDRPPEIKKGKECWRCMLGVDDCGRARHYGDCGETEEC